MIIEQFFADVCISRTSTWLHIWRKISSSRKCILEFIYSDTIRTNTHIYTNIQIHIFHKIKMQSEYGIWPYSDTSFGSNQGAHM